MFQRSLLHALLTLLNTQTNFSFRASLLFKKVSCPLSRRQLAHCQAARVILWKKKKKGVRRPLTPQKLVQFGELEVPSIRQRRTSVSLSKVEFTQCPGEIRNFWILCSVDRLQPNTVSLNLPLSSLYRSSVHADSSWWEHCQTRLMRAASLSPHWHANASRISAQTLETRANTDIWLQLDIRFFSFFLPQSSLTERWWNETTRRHK